MKFNWKNFLTIAIGVLLGYFYTEYQQYFVPQHYARPILMLAYLIIFTGIFMVIRPAKPYELSKWMSLWLTVIALFIIGVEDIGIKHIPVSELMPGTLVILGATVIAPFVSGYIFSILSAKKKQSSKKKKRK